MPAIDSLLAATALHHDVRLVTRNTRDFDYAGLEVINPWGGGGNGGCIAVSIPFVGMNIPKDSYLLENPFIGDLYPFKGD